MVGQDIIDRLIKDFPGLIFNKYPIPIPYVGSYKIKAIVLGADPTHIINDENIAYLDSYYKLKNILFFYDNIGRKHINILFPQME